MAKTLTEPKAYRVIRPTAFTLTVQVLSCLVVFAAVIWAALAITEPLKANPTLTATQAQVLRFIWQYETCYATLVIGIPVIINAVVYSLLFRFAKTTAAYPCCAFMILCQAVIVTMI